MSDFFGYNYKKVPDTSKFINFLSYFNMIVGMGTLKSGLQSYQFVFCFLWSLLQHFIISKTCQHSYGENILWCVYPAWACANLFVCICSSCKLNKFHRELLSFDKKLKKICGNSIFFFLPLKYTLLLTSSFIIVFLFSMYCVVYLLNSDEIFFLDLIITYGFVAPFYSVFVVNLMFSYILAARFQILAHLWTQQLVLHRSGPVKAELGLEKLRVLHSNLKNIVILFNEATTLCLLLFFAAIFINVLFIFYLTAYDNGIHIIYIVNALFSFCIVFAVIQFTENLHTSVSICSLYTNVFAFNWIAPGVKYINLDFY